MSPADSHLKVIAFHGKDSGLSRPAVRYTPSSGSMPKWKSPGQENIGEPIKSPTMENGGYSSGMQQTHSTVHGKKWICYFVHNSLTERFVQHPLCVKFSLSKNPLWIWPDAVSTCTSGVFPAMTLKWLTLFHLLWLGKLRSSWSRCARKILLFRFW